MSANDYWRLARIFFAISGGAATVAVLSAILSLSMLASGTANITAWLLVPIFSLGGVAAYATWRLMGESW